MATNYVTRQESEETIDEADIHFDDRRNLIVSTGRSLTDVKDMLARIAFPAYTVAMATAALYAVFFFASLVWEHFAWGARAGVTLNLNDNPRLLIALSLLFAVAFMWLFRGAKSKVVGRVLSILFLGYALLQFVWWYEMTNRIEATLDGGPLTGAGALGRIWLGAGLGEPLALAAALVLLAFNVYYLGESLFNYFAGGATQDTRDPVRLHPRPH